MFDRVSGCDLVIKLVIRLPPFILDGCPAQTEGQPLESMRRRFNGVPHYRIGFYTVLCHG